MKDIPDNINNAIQEFVNEVNNLLGNRIKKIVLYGSYARGDFNESSDIDIMVLTDLTDDEIVAYRDNIIDIAYDIEEENDFDIILSPLLKNIDKYNRRINVIPFYMNVQREGVILNG